MIDFNELWKFATRHGPIVQDKIELEHIFKLIQGCESYLEIGTAEGNSLYVLSHALQAMAPITYIDYGENHTEKKRAEVLAKIPNPICEILRDSHDFRAVRLAYDKGPYDVVFIDAGHTYEDVLLDAMSYGHLASKFIIFHDIQLPNVRQAFDWYVKKNLHKVVSKFIRSEEYGYGIVCL